MAGLVELMILPLAVCLLAIFCRSTRVVSRLAPLLFWIQVLFVSLFVSPILLCDQAKCTFSQDFALDHLGAMFTVLTQVVVACAVTHARVFFEQEGAHTEEDTRFVRIFYICTSLFLLSMTSIFFCDNLGFLWISVEATTLTSAPLVYYHRTKHSLEAAWKYLIICSVGIAFALLGTMLVFASSQYGAVPNGSLSLSLLSQHAYLLQAHLLRLGFLFCLLGYGTKAGVFPLHSWLPDAHSEAPAPASAMLSGGLLNCALFAIWRFAELVRAAGHPDSVRNIAMTAGVITIVAASLFLVKQHILKRMLAYSSVENVGLMLTAIGLGSGPLFFLLALNHSAAKVALFLVSGNVIQSTGTKSLDEIRGTLAANPCWAAVLIAGAFAVTGSPPFGAFIAEWSLLTESSQMQLWPLVIAVVLALAVSFLAVMTHVGKIVCGTPKPDTKTFSPFGSSFIPVGLVAGTFLAGVIGLLSFLR